jgi:hypothetical protein
VTDAACASTASVDPLAEIVGRHGAERRAAWRERERLRALIARHEAAIGRLPIRGAGTALSEIAELVTDRTGLAASVSGPFGMNNDYGLSVEEREGVSAAYFKLRPRADDAEFDLVDLESDDARFPQGSLGRMNGSHMRTVPMPDLDALLRMIEEQRAENRLRRMIS